MKRDRPRRLAVNLAEIRIEELLSGLPRYVVRAFLDEDAGTIIERLLLIYCSAYGKQPVRSLRLTHDFATCINRLSAQFIASFYRPDYSLNRRNVQRFLSAN